MKTIQITDEQFAALERIGQTLEKTAEEVAAYFLGFLDDPAGPQYEDASEIAELVWCFDYKPRVEKRVRVRLAAMIRAEQHFSNPVANEVHAVACETGQEVPVVRAAFGEELKAIA